MTTRQAHIINVLEHTRYIAACELIREYDCIRTLRAVGKPQEYMDWLAVRSNLNAYDEATHNLISYRQMLMRL